MEPQDARAQHLPILNPPAPQRARDYPMPDLNGACDHHGLGVCHGLILIGTLSRGRAAGIWTRVRRRPRWRGHLSRLHKSGPGHPRFRVVLGGLTRDAGNADQHIAGGALDLPSRELFLALQMLIAVWTIEFEFTHSWRWVSPSSPGWDARGRQLAAPRRREGGRIAG
jgi:hypothetical protein